MKKVQRLIAFDFGTKRIGVASGQVITSTAQPLPPLSAQEGIPNWQKVEELLSEWQPDALVVGLPLNMDGTNQELTLRAQRFGRRLNGRFQLPVFEQDERLTSVEARAELFDREGFRGLKGRSIDSLAACLILEDWFRSQA